ncbi:MAG: glycosyltransferase family 39 protein [bacterium]
MKKSSRSRQKSKPNSKVIIAPTKMSLSSRFFGWSHWHGLLVGITLIAITLLLYVNLGRDSLFNWDEGIYAELGRQLIITRDILTSHWNGALWLEKPPGIAWVTALSMSIFGVNELGARAFMPLFAALTLFFVFRIGRKFGGWQYGAIAMTLLATFDLFLSRSRAVNVDGMLLAALTGTIYATLLGVSPLVIALGIFAGVWVKGIAGLLIALLILPLLFKRGWSYLLRVAGYSIFLIAPWHLYQYFINKSLFYTPYLLEQVVKRATVPIEFHIESRWFYFQFLQENLKGGVLYLLLGSIVITLYNFMRNRKLSSSIFLLWWLALPLGIFTLAKTRLYWYILPIYPAIALLISYLFTRFNNTNLERRLVNILIIGLCVQSLFSVSQSVEIDKKSALAPPDVDMALSLRVYQTPELAILVPESERVAEAILPLSQRIGSSFRYGGSPNLVFYSQKHVTYYYNVDEWIAALNSIPSLTMFATADMPRLPASYVVESINKSYVTASQGEDAVR